MRLYVSPMLERIGRGLHVQYDDIAKEPLPARWVDLIKHLNEKEDERRKVEARPRGRLS